VDDLVVPEFFLERHPKARKAHLCNECSGTIRPGEVYQYISGKWDHEFAAFKTCSACERLRSWSEDQDVRAGFGELYATLDEYDLREEIPPLLLLAMQAR